MATINGDSGDNTLVGTSEADTLTGNGGRDTFLTVRNTTNDTITDFATDDTLLFLITNQFTAKLIDQDALQVAASGGNTTVRPDTDLNGSFETGFTLNGSFAASNFVVVPNLLYVPSPSDPDFEGYIANGARVLLTDAAGGSTTLTSDRGLSSQLTFGTDGAQTLTGGSGDDTIAARSGNDTVNGGAGYDLIAGGRGNDQLNGQDGNDILTGDNGDDTLNGGNGNDQLVGGDGTDSLTGGAGRDILQGGADADRLIGNTGNDELYGDGGRDTLTGGDGDDVLNGGSDNDSLMGDDGDDSAFAGSGNDTVEGGDGDDLLIGEAGNDVLYGESANGSSSAMSNDLLSGGDGDDLIFGGVGNDTIDGGNGNDTLNGESGNDVLIGGAGADSMNGGTGIDTVDYSANAVGVNARLYQELAVGGDANGDILIDIENVIGSNFNDTLIGESGGVANRLEGGAGNDLLNGGSGADTLIGGAGSDTAEYSGSNNAVNVRLYQQIGLRGEASGDQLIGIENLIGSRFDDTLLGQSLGEANFISGGDGNDFANGGSGNDTLRGGRGADTLEGGNDFDTADYADAFSAVNVRLYQDLAIADGEVDTLISIENATGSNFNDILIGTSGGQANVLNGGGGNDTLNGGSGADTLIGGAGSDTAEYSGSNNAVNVRIYQNIGLRGEASGDVLQSIENLIGSRFDDTLIGESNGQANRIAGGDGDDFINTGSGADILVGGDGADTLQGGTGADLFEFSRDGDLDTVMDYEAGVDTISLRGYGASFDSFAEVQGAASQQGADVRIDFGSGDVILLEDTQVSALVAGDFEFI